MHMAETMDTGDIILQRTEPIRSGDTGATLHDRLADLGAGLASETIELIDRGAPLRTPQDDALATYAKKLSKEDGRIDWSNEAVVIERQIRAFDPWPGAFTRLGDTMLKVWKAQVTDLSGGPPGEIREGLMVGTGRQGLQILEIQPAGGRRMSAEAFLRGHPVEAGMILG
jgi:methionyl-tRNA formyltransferase